jgi:ADP-heptose:LPS heptosyltransferase
VSPAGVEPPLLARLDLPPRRVAVVRASRIGDFVCATPALRALRAALPEAEVTLVALPFIEPLARRLASVDRFEAFPGFPGIAEQFFDPARLVQFLGRMQSRRFDLAVQLHGTGVYSNAFTLMLGAQATAGFVRPGDRADLLDAALPFPARGHEAQRLLALAECLGAPAQGEETEFPLRSEDRAEAAALLAGAPRPLIGLHAGARDAEKRWRPEGLARVARELLARYGGRAVVLGSEEELRAAATIAATLGARCLDLAGLTSLPVLGAVIERLDVLLTTDSAPAHIAYALGQPSVTLFRETEPARWGPPLPGPHAVLEARLHPDADGAALEAAAALLGFQRAAA